MNPTPIQKPEILLLAAHLVLEDHPYHFDKDLDFVSLFRVGTKLHLRSLHRVRSVKKH